MSDVVKASTSQQQAHSVLNLNGLVNGYSTSGSNLLYTPSVMHVAPTYATHTFTSANLGAG